MRPAGFTLVEMLVVLAILALVMAIAPSFLAASGGGASLRAARSEIAAALVETRSLAIRKGRSEALAFDSAGGYRAGAGGKRRQLPQGLTVALHPAMAARNNAPRAVRFFPDGSSTGGSLVLTEGRRRVGIAIDWITGRVTPDATP